MKDKKRSKLKAQSKPECSTLHTQSSKLPSSPVPIVGADSSGGSEEATAQGRAAEELRESEVRFRTLADTAPVMLWVTESDGSCSFLSRGWYEFTGQTEQEAFGKAGFGWLGAVHPDDREQSWRMFLEANEKRRSFSLDYRLRRHDGEYRWAIDVGRPRFGPNGEFLGYIGSVLDITDRKRIEQQLRRSEQELADFFENATVGLHWVGPEGIILRANRAELKLLGYAIDEYIGHHIAEFHADQDVIDDILRRLTAGEELQDYEARLRCKDGSVKHVLISSNVLWEDGRFIHTRCFTRDITERKRAEEALKQSEEQFRSFVRSTDDAIVMLDRLGLIIFWNPGAEKLFGYAQSEVLGKPMTLLIPERFRERHKRGIERASAAGHLTAPVNMFELVGLRKDGTEFPSEISVSSWSTGNGCFFTGIVRDITKHKQAELLLASEKKVLELIASGAALPEVLATLMHETEAQSTDGMLCSVLLADETGQRLLHGAAPSLPQAYNEAVHGIVIGPAVGSCGTAAFERKPVFITDIAADRRWADFKDLATAHDLGTCCSTPIFSCRDELLGTVAMYYRQPHNPSQADCKLIERTAQLASIAIERDRVEKALRKSEERYHSIFEKAVDGIFQTTAGGKYADVNPALARIYGYDSPDDMIATITDIASQLYVDPGRRDEFLRLMQAQEKVTDFESLVYRKDGSFIWISESARTLRDQAGTVVGYEGTVEDITERKRAEGRLRDTLDHVRTLSGRLATLQEEERAHIARELHDELGVRLTCLKIDLSRLMSVVGHRVRADLRAKLNDRVRSMVGQVDSTIASLQRLVTQLRPALLDDLGLVAAIEWQSRDFQKRTGISCTCEISADDIVMEPERATTVFRIFQEALTNTARHAHATAVTIMVTSQRDSLQLVVADNGVGVPDTKVSDRRSLGLLGMRERAAQWGGTVTIEGDPEKGTTVNLCLPVGGDSLTHKREPC